MGISIGGPGDALPDATGLVDATLNRNTGKQTLLTGAGIVFLQGAAFLTSMLIARGLGAEAFGRFQVVTSLSIFATFLAVAGMDEAVAYLLPKYHATQLSKVSGLAAYALAFSAAFSLILGLFLSWRASDFERLLGMDGISFDLQFTLPLLPALIVMTMAMSLLRGLGRAEWRAYIYYFLIGSLFLGGVLMLMANGLTSEEAYRARIVSLAIGATVALVLVYRAMPEGSVSLQMADIGTLHNFAGWLVFVGLFQYLIEQPFIDLLLVAHYETSAAVGLYSVAAKAAAVAAIGGTALNVVMASVFARIRGRGDTAELRERYRQASRWLAAAALGSGGLILLFHREVLLLFGAEYQAAGTVLQVYAVGQIVAGLLGVNTPVLLACGLARVEFCLSAAACATLVAAGVLLGQRFGAPGVAVASGLSTGGLALARKIAVRRVLNRDATTKE